MIVRDLAAECAEFLAERPEGASATSVASGIRARVSLVRAALKSDARFSGPVRADGAQSGPLLYLLSRGAGDGQGRPSRLTQTDLVLRVLRDGGWHSTASILRRVPCIVHSRIADLRRLGHVVEHRCVGPGATGHQYRLDSAAAARRAA